MIIIIIIITEEYPNLFLYYYNYDYYCNYYYIYLTNYAPKHTQRDEKLKKNCTSTWRDAVCFKAKKKKNQTQN